MFDIISEPQERVKKDLTDLKRFEGFLADRRLKKQFASLHSQKVSLK